MAVPASDMTRDITVAGAKTAPPVAVSLAAHLGALTLNDWLAIATIVYVVLQTGYLVWKWSREWRAARRLRGAS